MADAAHNQLLNAIKSGEAHLKHVETVDKSKPAIDASTHVGTWDKKGFLSDIKGGAPLKHVETDDRSGPKIEPDVHIKPNPHNALLEELKKKTSQQE